MWSIAAPQFPPAVPKIAADLSKLERLIETAEKADKNLENLEDEIAVLYQSHRNILTTLINREMAKSVEKKV